MTFIRSFSKVIRSLCLVLEMYSGKEDVCGLKDSKSVYKKKGEEGMIRGEGGKSRGGERTHL